MRGELSRESSLDLPGERKAGMADWMVPRRGLVAVSLSRLAPRRMAALRACLRDAPRVRAMLWRHGEDEQSRGRAKGRVKGRAKGRAKGF